MELLQGSQIGLAESYFERQLRSVSSKLGVLVKILLR